MDQLRAASSYPLRYNDLAFLLGSLDCPSSARAEAHIPNDGPVPIPAPSQVVDANDSR
jgi:hypothetical protein